MARHRRSGGVKESAVRRYVLDDATGAVRPAAARSEESQAASDSPTARMDERIARWMQERERFERRNRPTPPPPPADPHP